MDSNRDRPAEELWSRTLSKIPTAYGRLVYLASLRDPDSGRYRHHGLAMVFSEKAAHEALAGSHLNSFREWLAMSLEEQKADLDVYMSEQPTDQRTLVENWIRLQPFRNLMPAPVTAPEEELFLADVAALLSVLRNESAGGVPGRSG